MIAWLPLWMMIQRVGRVIGSQAGGGIVAASASNDHCKIVAPAFSSRREATPLGGNVVYGFPLHKKWAGGPSFSGQKSFGPPRAKKVRDVLSDVGKGRRPGVGR